MGLADNYLSQVRPLLEKPYLNPVERAELEDVFYQFKEEAEFIFPNLNFMNKCTYLCFFSLVDLFFYKGHAKLYPYAVLLFLTGEASSLPQPLANLLSFVIFTLSIFSTLSYELSERVYPEPKVDRCYSAFVEEVG